MRIISIHSIKANIVFDYFSFYIIWNNYILSFAYLLVWGKRKFSDHRAPEAKRTTIPR